MDWVGDEWNGCTTTHPAPHFIYIALLAKIQASITGIPYPMTALKVDGVRWRFSEKGGDSGSWKITDRWSRITVSNQSTNLEDNQY